MVDCMAPNEALTATDARFTATTAATPMTMLAAVRTARPR
jgi:hypothetical protein